MLIKNEDNSLTVEKYPKNVEQDETKENNENSDDDDIDFWL